MNTKVLFVLLLAVVAAGCQAPSATDNIQNISTEILFQPVVAQQMPADQITYFGVQFGASEQDVIELHGEPLERNEYAFGRTVNLEYDLFGDNQTTVLYHFEQGALQSVLVNGAMEPNLAYDSLLNNERADIYRVLGVPTRSEELPTMERMFIYDEFGYEFFTRRGEVLRTYFTTPNRGIEPVGRDKVINESNNPPIICAQVITYAQNNQSCAAYPTPCDVPQGWEVIEEPTPQQQENCEFVTTDS